MRPSVMAKLAVVAAWAGATMGVAQAGEIACGGAAATSCRLSLELPGGGRFNYLASARPGDAQARAGPVQAIVGVHGHPRDALKTYDAIRAAVVGAHAETRTLIVAPIFQVAPENAARCKGDGFAPATASDLTWTCASWIEGGPAASGGMPKGSTAFGAMDALVEELAHRWPTLQRITIAGFSAGAQLVQHYVGFAASPAGSVPSVRYVVSSPGSWLYFDPKRPGDDPLLAQRCPGFDDWKYGLNALPDWLDRGQAGGAKARYGAADVRYLVGELGAGPGRGAAYSILDKSCAAEAQGPTRLQRALAYSAYDRESIAPRAGRLVTVVPGCAHDVACVFPSPDGAAALLGH